MKLTRRGFIGSTAGAMVVAIIPKKVKASDGRELETYYLQLNGHRANKAAYMIQRALDFANDNPGTKCLVLFPDYPRLQEAIQFVSVRHEENRLKLDMGNTFHSKNGSTVHFVSGPRATYRINSCEYGAVWMYGMKADEMEEAITRVRLEPKKIEWTE